MAWSDGIDESTAEGALREAYVSVAAARGRVANILKIHSLSPATMTAQLGLYKALMFGRSTLSRRERETIAVAVSTINGCHY